MVHVLLVEDDPEIRSAIQPYTDRQGWSLSWARSVSEAMRQLEMRKPDIVLVDRGLPDVSGDALARELAGGTTPFIMLTARSREDDRLSGFDLGADDYVVKPFSAAELIKRIEVVLRRRGVPRVRIGEGVEIDREARIVAVHGRSIGLTATEFALFDQLASRPERVFARSELSDLLALSLETSDRALDSHIKNIRKKVREAGGNERLIETVVGTGYVMRRPG